jgi:FkbM family methyltransferase
MSKIKTFGSHLVDFDLIPSNGVFIDAGACQGNFIKDVRSILPESYIIALEPNVKNYDELVGQLNPKMLLLQMALVAGHEPKKMKFAAFPDLPEWGNVTGLYGNRKHEFYDVHTIDIGELLEYVPDGVVHHLKMDIEGCEHGVIADLTTTQAEDIHQISMEVHSGLQQLLLHLTNLGYRCDYEKGELYAVRKEL